MRKTIMTLIVCFVAVVLIASLLYVSAGGPILIERIMATPLP